ncbi:hypothetical protein D3X12_22295 [Pseudomonas protegens]|jgi:hypothetical protein|nr:MULTISPECIES: hypothetical protein [Pseudomonas]BCQ62661.1 hypothetical protein PBOI14_44110 [Pseudomonas sp. Boi14]GED73314.1 hypothetical protein PFL02_01640 [Pseudomonas fluorescens]AGL85229.1 hypothetical protein PFLCHA0_c34600 [Pseudomonas protegens CHA0]AQT10335.1 hypothetical protein H78_03671 [Pseudomonas protegens]ASE23121.1 hypothetical protein CEP86_22600 [Pseudomonas protegens]
MNIGNTPPANYSYAQLSKVLEHNRSVAQVKGPEAPVEQEFAAHLEAEQAVAKDDALKLSLSFSAQA